MRTRRYLLPPLDTLPAFESAARNLSFTRAASELNLTQSAVSRQIQALEERLGTRLFERRHRALLLTPPGQLLYREVAQMLGRLDATVSRLKAEASKRTVTITTTPGLAALWLIPRLGRFTQAHAGLDVRISAAYEVLPLERSGIDVALRYCSEETAQGGTLLFAETVFPVCSPSLLSDPQRPLLGPDDLHRHALLFYDDPRGATPWLDWGVWLESVGFPGLVPQATLRFSQYDQLIQSAVGGQGVALGRSPLIRQLLTEGKLVAPFAGAVASPRAYYVIRSEASAGNADVDALVDWLAAEAQPDRVSADEGGLGGRVGRPGVES